MVATVTPVATSQSHRRWSRRDVKRLLKGLLFISPWIIGFCGLLLYPIYYTIKISFTDYSGFGTPKWIGLGNYRFMMHDSLFWTAVYNTVYYTALAVPLGVVVALVLAIAMNQPVRESSFYRAIIYLPSIIPLFTLAFIMQILMSPTQGVFNQFFIWLGLPNINWFGDPRYSKLALVIIAQYGAGQAALIFLAGLKGIPKPLYEAAAIDGAGTFRRFRNITLPMITPVILYDIILGLSLGLQIFTLVYIVSGDPPGGPANSTMVYVLFLYLNGFRYGTMGYAAAMAWVLFVVTAIISIFIFWSSNRWVNYDTQ